MIPILSRDQIRAFDRHAIDVGRVPSLVLMENAGRGAAERIATLARELGAEPRAKVVVVSGAGNNGGDGFVVARLLLTRGWDVSVVCTVSRDRLKGDALANHDAWVGLSGATVFVTESSQGALAAKLADATLIVDALFGTGLDRPVVGFPKAVIEAMNAATGVRVALDIPSGLDANTGAALGAAVSARETVTFAAYKLGLFASQAVDYVGRLTLADIGVPRDPVVVAVGQSARLLAPGDVATWLGRRSGAAHKGSSGRVVIVGGSPGKTGAALLSGHAALRAGAGLVTLSTSEAACAALDSRVLEEMTAPIDATRIEASLAERLEGARAVAVGPGLGLDAFARRVVDAVIFRWGGLKIVDADALSHLAGRLAELNGAPGKLILTPHPGEMGKLLGVTTAEVEADRFAAVRRAVEVAGAVVVLKGAHTIIGAPGELPVVSPIACPALATAGSGDVLTGITAGIGASLGDAFSTACAAVYVHGRAGETWVEQTGADRGLVAHEIADRVPTVIGELSRLFHA